MISTGIKEKIFIKLENKTASPCSDIPVSTDPKKLT